MKLYFAVLTALLSTATLASHAQKSSNTECFVPRNVSSTPTPQEWEYLRFLLSGQLEYCLNNSDYFALYGASLLYTGRLSSAIEMLERALLISPRNGAARVDYAQALYESGQLLSALQVNKQILSEKEVPTPIREALEKRQAAWRQKTHLWRTQFSYLTGHSSNLNNATYIRDYERTYPEYNYQITQSILDSSREKSGAYQYLNLTSQYYNLNNQGTSLLTLAAQTRNSRLHKSDTDEFSLEYELNREGLSLNQQWGIGLEHLRFGDSDLYSSLETSYRITPRHSPSYLKLAINHTHFNRRNTLDDLLFVFEPGVIYQLDQDRLGFNFSIGFNKALQDRAGGNRYTKKATAFYDFPLGGGRATSSIGYSYSQDSNGYSQYLNNNLERNTEVWFAGVQYFYPITQDFTVHSSYYYRNQDSNIGVFKTKHESIDLGFTYRF